ncbi:MAG: amidohydrolase family protein [Oceanicaulis sp.]
MMFDSVYPGRLPDDVTVIDPVIHAFNLTRENIASKYGAQLYAMSYGLHSGFSPPEAVIEQDVYMTDMPVEALVKTIFTETQTDFAATHTLRLDTWFKDGFCARKKTEEAATRWPDRVLAYLGVDPTQDLNQVLDDLEDQHAALPHAIGLKLYPHQVDPYRSFRAGDEKVLRVIERARDLGIRTLAIHKALPNGSVPLESYRIDDMDEAADAFPSMNFEIIHAGMAFVEETAFAISRFPNVYANLETTTALLWRAPGRFADVIAQLLFWGGPEKLVWSTGCTVTHPQHLLERFWALQFDEATMNRVGVPQLDEQTKRNILGLNYARLAGIDLDARLAKVKGDEFDKARSRGLKPVWSSWREMALEQA